MDDVSTPEQGTPEVQIPADFSAFEHFRNTGELPKAPDAEPEKPAQESSDAPEKGAETDPDSDPETEQEAEDERPDEFTKKGLAKRFSKLTDRVKTAEQRAAEAERRLAEIQGSRPAKEDAPPKPEGKPKLDDFETYEAYTEALTDWKVQSALKERETREAKSKADADARAQQDAWSKRVSEFSQKHEDFSEVLASVEVPITKELQQAILDSDIGPAVAYHLAQHPEEIERMGKLSPIATAREIGKLEARLSVPAEKPKPKASAAPAPIKPVGQRAAATAKPLREVDDFTEFERRRNAGERP